jgi:hypothetical protein
MILDFEDMILNFEDEMSYNEMMHLSLTILKRERGLA